MAQRGIRGLLEEREATQRELVQLRRAVEREIEVERLVRELTEQKEAAECEVVELRQAVEKQTELQRRVGEVTEEKETAQREVVELRQVVEKEDEQLKVLASQIELMSSREKELREMLLDAHDQLLRRDDEIQATLAAVLEQNASGTATAIGQGEKGSVPSRYLRYQQLIHQIREVVRTVLPPDAAVIVVSKGDDELLKLGGCKAWHFPQTGQGVYAGYYPADSAAAIAQLEALRAKGGQFLLFPSTAFWWLGHYEDFRHHLDARCGRIWGDEQCVIYQLSRSCEPQPGLMRRTLSHLSMVRTKVHWR